MSEITKLLSEARTGNRDSLDRVFELLYPELRRLAAARASAADGTVSPTVLVNELFLRFCSRESLALSDRQHFMACAARAMRGLAIDHVRSTVSLKRGGGAVMRTLTDGVALVPGVSVDLLDLDRALDALDAVDAQQRELVELHWFAGLDFCEIAELRAVNERTVRRAWQRARAFLAAQLHSREEGA